MDKRVDVAPDDTSGELATAKADAAHEIVESVPTTRHKDSLDQSAKALEPTPQGNLNSFLELAQQQSNKRAIKATVAGKVGAKDVSENPVAGLELIADQTEEDRERELEIPLTEKKELLEKISKEKLDLERKIASLDKRVYRLSSAILQDREKAIKSVRQELVSSLRQLDWEIDNVEDPSLVEDTAILRQSQDRKQRLQAQIEELRKQNEEIREKARTDGVQQSYYKAREQKILRLQNDLRTCESSERQILDRIELKQQQLKERISSLQKESDECREQLRTIHVEPLAAAGDRQIKYLTEEKVSHRDDVRHINQECAAQTETLWEAHEALEKLLTTRQESLTTETDSSKELLSMLREDWYTRIQQAASYSKSHRRPVRVLKEREVSVQMPDPPQRPQFRQADDDETRAQKEELYRIKLKEYEDAQNHVKAMQRKILECQAMGAEDYESNLRRWSEMENARKQKFVHYNALASATFRRLQEKIARVRSFEVEQEWLTQELDLLKATAEKIWDEQKKDEIVLVQQRLEESNRHAEVYRLRVCIQETKRKYFEASMLPFKAVNEMERVEFSNRSKSLLMGLKTRKKILKSTVAKEVKRLKIFHDEERLLADSRLERIRRRSARKAEHLQLVRLRLEQLRYDRELEEALVDGEDLRESITRRGEAATSMTVQPMETIGTSLASERVEQSLATLLSKVEDIIRQSKTLQVQATEFGVKYRLRNISELDMTGGMKCLPEDLWLVQSERKRLDSQLSALQLENDQLKLDLSLADTKYQAKFEELSTALRVSREQAIANLNSYEEEVKLLRQSTDDSLRFLHETHSKAIETQKSTISSLSDELQRCIALYEEKLRDISARNEQLEGENATQAKWIHSMKKEISDQKNDNLGLKRTIKEMTESHFQTKKELERQLGLCKRKIEMLESHCEFQKREKEVLIRHQESSLKKLNLHIEKLKQDIVATEERVQEQRDIVCYVLSNVDCMLLFMSEAIYVLAGSSKHANDRFRYHGALGAVAALCHSKNEKVRLYMTQALMKLGWDTGFASTCHEKSIQSLWKKWERQYHSRDEGDTSILLVSKKPSFVDLAVNEDLLFPKNAESSNVPGLKSLRALRAKKERNDPLGMNASDNNKDDAYISELASGKVNSDASVATDRMHEGDTEASELKKDSSAKDDWGNEVEDQQRKGKHDQPGEFINGDGANLLNIEALSESPGTFQVLMQLLSGTDNSMRVTAARSLAVLSLHDRAPAIFHRSGYLSDLVNLLVCENTMAAAAVNCALANLLQRPGPHRRALCDLGILPILFKYCRESTNVEILMHSVSSILSLTSTEDISPFEELEDCVRTLIDLCSSDRHTGLVWKDKSRAEEVEANAIGALSYILSGSPKAYLVEICTNHARMFISMLGSPHARLIEATTIILETIATTEKQRKLLVRMDAVHALFAAMKGKTATIVQNVLRTICQLSKCSLGQNAVGKFLPELFICMRGLEHPGDLQIRETSTDVLANCLYYNKELGLVLARQGGAVASLVGTICPNYPIDNNRDPEAKADHIEEPSACISFPSLVMALNVLRCVASLSYEPEVSHIMCCEGILQVLIAILQKTEEIANNTAEHSTLNSYCASDQKIFLEKLKETIAISLLNVSLPEENKVFFMKPGVIEALVVLQSEPNRSISGPASSALESLSDLGTKEDLDNSRKTLGVPQLLGLIDSQDQEVVLTAVESLADSSWVKEADAKKVGESDSLRSIYDYCRRTISNTEMLLPGLQCLKNSIEISKARNQRLIQQLDGIDMLLYICQQQAKAHVGVTAAALQALLSAVEDNEQCSREVMKCGGLDILLAIAGRDDSDSRSGDSSSTKRSQRTDDPLIEAGVNLSELSTRVLEALGPYSYVECSNCGYREGGGQFCSNCGRQLRFSTRELRIPEA